jgi:hypothetical protein
LPFDPPSAMPCSSRKIFFNFQSAKYYLYRVE